MKKLISHFLKKISEPKVEQALIIILPCISVLIATIILAPRFLYYILPSAESTPAQHSPELTESYALPPISPSPAVTAEPSPQPTPVPTPMLPPDILKIDDGSGWRIENGKRYYYDSRGNKLAGGVREAEGKLYYFTQDGAAASKLGIDVSKYNKGINWQMVKNKGIDFAILRAGGRGWESGLIYDDACFKQNLAEAKKAGVDIGVYFYSTAINRTEAIDEANYVLELIRGYELEYPVFIDVEPSGDFPWGRSDRLQKGLRTDIIHAFCGTVIDAGYRAGLYSGNYFLQYYLDYDSVSRYTIWMANYTRNNALPKFNKRYDIWQYTELGLVSGIRGVVDMNVIF